MAVAFVSTITAWGGLGGPPVNVSGTFTPTATNFLAIANFDGGGTGKTLQYSGTVNTPVSKSTINDATDGNTLGMAECTNITGGSQTVTVSSSTAGTDAFSGWAWEYSGVVTTTYSTNANTGVTTAVGVAKTVATGSILLALCIRVDAGGGNIPSPSANGGVTPTTRGSGTNGTVFAAAEYAGNGGSITPTFGTLTSGNYIVLQVLMDPAAGATPTQHQENPARPRPGRGPFSVGKFFISTPDAITSTSVLVSVPSASLTLDAKVPTVTVSANQTISVPLATITLAAQTPTVTVSANNAIAVPVASITLDGKVPTVTATANNLIAVPLATISLNALTPSVAVGGNQSVSVPVASLTLDAFAPTVQNGANQSVAVPKASLTLDAFAPTISQTTNQTVAVPVASITLDGFAPTVTASANNLIAVPVATMSLNAIAPSVQSTGPNVIDVPLAAISLTVYAPTVVNSTPDGARHGGRGRSKKSFDEARKYSDRIRKQLDDVLEDVSEIYRELIDGPQIIAKEAAQIVKPFAAPEAKTIPQPAVIDWQALENDSERVSHLVSLWLRQQRRLEMLRADDEWMMLGD